jgi:hypothetical protein
MGGVEAADRTVSVVAIAPSTNRAAAAVDNAQPEQVSAPLEWADG